MCREADPDGIRILVSACLLGDPVRYDGRHKRDAWIVETLGRHVEFVKVCPEVEVGMGVPREPVRLVAAGPGGRTRLVAPGTGTDWTDRMEAFAKTRLDELAGLDLCGYLCKSGSPSSGLAGVFTRAFMERFPLIPVEEEGRLADPAVREAFVDRVFGWMRRRDAERGGRDGERLADLQARLVGQMLRSSG